MKKTAKKLTLSRETLRSLVDGTLEEVRGGTLWSNCYCHYTLQTNCTCQSAECW